MTTEDFKRKLTAILSADVVGYSRLMGEDETATVKTLEIYKGVMSSLIKQHRGRVVDSPGDNLLVEFGSVVDAVQCAVSIQKELQTRNAELPENRRMDFRIGINLGDVIEEEDRIYGDGVNIAARLEALADPGGICISKTAFDHIENKLPLGYEFLGDQTVKNITKPIGAYRVLLEPRVTSVKEVKKKKAIPFWKRRTVLSFGIIIILAIFAGLALNYYPRGPSIEPASVDRMAYPLPDKPSIAVLPFTNMSGDPEQDYIGDGLSENIISALSVSSKMFVIPRSATFGYKGKSIKPQQVAEDFGVQYVLEGSIMKSGNRLRVTAQLIDTIGGHYLWSEVYDREMEELFELLDEITKKIVVSLQVKLLDWGEDLRIFAKTTDNLEAWKHYIKGDELFWNFTKEDNIRAREHFEAALKLDPDYAGVISYLAISHLLDSNNGWSDSPLTSMNLAFKLAQKAVKLDDQSADAHGILGLVYLYQREHEKAIDEMSRSIKLNSNSALGHGDFATIMVYSGRFDEAITLSEKAFRLNPNLTNFYLWPMAVSYLFLERYEDALKLSHQMERNTHRGFFFPWLYQELGREEEARAYMQEFIKKQPYMSLETLRKGQPFKNPDHLQRILDALRKAGMPEHPPGAVQEKPSIAVLPFLNISPEKDQEYFVDGLSEEILNSLTQIRNLNVTGRTSSFSFKGTNKKAQEIANELGVEYILEGSVRKAGKNLRITAQLLRGSDGFHLWSKTYDEEFKIEEMFSVQEDIANSVADKLKLTLEAFQLLGGTENIEAYELYLNARGKYFAEGNKEVSMDMINNVIGMDSQFAHAWALKAQIHLQKTFDGSPSQSKAEAEASLRAGQKAIDLEPNLAYGYVTLGAMKMFKSEWIEAETNIRKALELINFSLSDDTSYIAAFYISVGKFKRAHELLEEIKRNDPLNQTSLAWLYFAYNLIGDRERSEEEYRNRNKSMSKADSDWHDDAITFVRVGTGDELSSNDIVFPIQINVIGKEYLDSPKEGLKELRRIYDSNDNISSRFLSRIAIWAAYFGDPEFALDALERGAAISSDLVPCWFPVMKEVRQLPRFKEFVRKIGLVEYWETYGWPVLCRPVGDDDFECD